MNGRETDDGADDVLATPAALIEARARDRLAAAVSRRGPAWRNAADGIRSGSVSNCWIEAAVEAISDTLRG